MAAHPYSLRTRLNNYNTSTTSPPTKLSSPRTRSRSPRKPITGTTLKLRSILGSTTANPSGLTAHPPSRTFAYCAGSVAVTATISQDGDAEQRFYKARPLAGSINAQTSYYDQCTPRGTPTKRKSIMPGTPRELTPAASPIRSRREDETAQTWTARERIKAITAVSLSHDGRLLAVGETGYGPRVIIFSTSDIDGYDVPLSIMGEHSFGVRSVCFSPDSRFLATLGDANDGFLFIWNINPGSAAATLHSTNKCKADVRDMIWIGNSLVTIGTRHIKVWRIEDNPTISPARRGRSAFSSATVMPFSPSPLAGRNVLLGPLVDCTFTCGVAISRQEAIIGSEDGAICLLHDDGNVQRLQLLKQNNAGLNALSFDQESGEVVIQDKHGKIWTESVESLKTPPRSPRRVTSGGRRISSGTPATATRSEPCGTRNVQTRTSGAVVAMSGFIVSTTRDGAMTVSEYSPSKPLKQIKKFDSHDGPIHGLLHLPEGSCGEFLTWTSSGQIKIWNLKGDILSTWRHTSQWEISGQDEGANDLIAVNVCSGSDIMMLGDQSGILTARDLTTWLTIYEIRAHGAQINCIRSQKVKDVVFVATCGRDRMVQLLRKTDDTFEIVQTMDDHIGAVTDVAFTTDGERLLSSSADRTIVVRERISRQVDAVESSAYLTVRMVTLKSTPLSMMINSSKLRFNRCLYYGSKCGDYQCFYWRARVFLQGI